MDRRFALLCATALLVSAPQLARAETSSFTQLYPAYRQETTQVPFQQQPNFTQREVPVLGGNRVRFPDGTVAHIMPWGHASSPNFPIANDFSAMSYHGGTIQRSPKQVLILWGFGKCTSTCTNDPNRTVPILFNFLKDVGGADYLDSTTQYFQKNGSLVTHITNPHNTLFAFLVDNNPAPTHPTPAQVAVQVQAAQKFLKQGNNKDFNYVVAFGFRHDPPGFGPGGFCAFHTAFGTRTSFQPFTEEPYVTEAGDACAANTVNGPLDGVSIVLGHEVGEAITDPGLNAWFDHSGLSGENGDKCANIGLNQNVSLNGVIFPVQPLFSNAGLFCSVT